ncbi:response regulator [Luteimonas abyssi]|uniref:response regulator n=1 Tax=Luteimonas abyssi TaxID=1247514 RepID=UPI000737C036|nr:response regulator [Luteimonas abyssi]
MPADPEADWRILIVDDSRDDAELTEIALRESGLPFACRWVSTGPALEEALPAFAPQLVISDLNLPGFSGEEALAIVRAHDPALPFVYLTGSLAPPEAPPRPAEGLLLKDDLRPLVPLVRELLGIA